MSDTGSPRGPALIPGPAVTAERVREAARRAGLPATGVLRLGSWTAATRFRAPFYRDGLASLFRGCFRDEAHRPPVGDLDATLYLLDGEDAARALRVRRHEPLPAPVLLRSADGGGWEFATNHVGARVFADEHPVTIVVWLKDPPSRRGPEAHFHFSVAVHKILLLLDRMYLHAGAVRFGNRVSVFVGDKGAGKSTVCLELARAGATVLADDHVLLARAGGRYVVSGCEAKARVTAETEAWLFGEPLPIAPQVQGAVSKKEFPITRFFRAEPYRDRRVHRLFFLRSGERRGVEPISGSDALRRLVSQTAWSHRFVDGDDYARYLHYLADLVAAVPAFVLSLSADLADLAGLGPLLATVDGPAHVRP